MESTVDPLTLPEIDSFMPLYTEILKTEFPGYSDKVVQFFLGKIYTRSSFFYWLSNNLKTVFVAKVNREIVGFAVIDEPYGGVSFCRWLGIKRGYQKKGIGTKLIDAWLLLAKQQECHKVEVAGQPEAKAFYEKIGLDLEGMRKLSYFGIDQYLFGRVIAQTNEEMMIK